MGIGPVAGAVRRHAILLANQAAAGLILRQSFQQPQTIYRIMDLSFKCPKCGQELEVDDSGAGEEIECPACSQTIRIPGTPPGGEAPPATGWASLSAPVIASSAAAKVKMHLSVPVHEGPADNLIAKPLAPLDVTAKETDRQLRVKCIRHVDCVEVGHDRFDEIVTKFLGKIGEQHLVSITTISFSHIDVASQKLLNDYGVMIVYRG